MTLNSKLTSSKTLISSLILEKITIILLITVTVVIALALMLALSLSRALFHGYNPKSCMEGTDKGFMQKHILREDLKEDTDKWSMYVKKNYHHYDRKNEKLLSSL